MVFLQSYVIMPDGRFQETENKSVSKISGLNKRSWSLRNLSCGRLRDFLEQYLTKKQNS